MNGRRQPWPQQRASRTRNATIKEIRAEMKRLKQKLREIDEKVHVSQLRQSDGSVMVLANLFLGVCVYEGGLDVFGQVTDFCFKVGR